MGNCKVHERVISQTQGSDGFLVVSGGRGLLARWRANNIAFQVSITAKQKTFRTENIGNLECHYNGNSAYWSKIDSPIPRPRCS